MFKISDNLSLPRDAVTQTFAILAKRGVGKTYTASVFAEELLQHGSQVVVIDPTGAWWGLRSSADGKSPGFPIVVFGGDHGDIPLEPGAGEIVAQNLVDGRFPAIIDLSLFRKAESRRFMTAFLETLYRKNREALHLVVDEADTFAPQSVRGDDAQVCGAMEDVVKKGRIRGLGCTLITQRPQVINKNVLTQCESILAMRLSHPKDIGAIKEWVGVHATEEDAAEVIKSLPSLPIGTAWFWSPGWLGKLVRIEVRTRTTFDSSATPKAGEKRKTPKSLAEIDIAKLTTEIQQTVERAKAEDPKRLKARIVELEKKLAAAPPPAAKPERIEVPMIDPKTLKAIEATADRLETMAEKLRGPMDLVAEKLRGILAAVRTPAPAVPQGTVHKVAGSVHNQPPLVHKAKVLPPKPPATAGGEQLSKAQQKILIALYWLRDQQATATKVAFFSGYRQSGSFTEALGELRRLGLLEGWTITQAGIDRVASVAGDKPRGADLREWLRPKLSAASNKLLDVLIAAHPRRLSNADLAEASGYKQSGSFTEALGDLRLIEAAEGGVREGGTKASDVFFE